MLSTLLDALNAAPDGRWAVILPDTGQRVTYGSLRARVTELAAALRAAGVGAGDRVAIALPNGLPSLVSLVAASLAGTAAPLNPAYTYEEFRFYMEDTGAKLLISDGVEEARRAAADGGLPVLPPDAAGAGSPPPPSPDDIALVLHTSGSTGRPKRVPLRHANLAVSIENIRSTYRLGPDDVSLCVMPLFHVHGLMASAMATLASGGTVVLPARFNPLAFRRLIREHGVTWYSAAPSIHQLALARQSEPGAGIGTLRFVRSCSAALPRELMGRMEDYFGAPVLEAYGMTEASHQMASNPLPPAVRKPGSVGTGTGVGIRIRNDRGEPLAVGQAGEVCIQGPNVIREYEDNPEATASSFFDGWFRTGDQGVLDQDGYLRLTGRLKELINRGGEKIAPREIDDVLLAHPAVSEAVCFGVPHAIWGEEVVAAVVLREPGAAAEADLIAYCRERLAEFKCPKRIHVTRTLPRTASGKIQRLSVANAFREK
jgi:acyl-CoA synthetase (AMP-forming)/AMP-acid ligase II